MNGKENIINKILSDADNKRREIIAAAEIQAEKISDDVKLFEDNEAKAMQLKAEANFKERSANSLANAELDARKYVLSEKQRLIGTCYAKAYAYIVKMNDKQKTAFLTKLINTYAESGETVYACKADKSVVTQKFLDGFNKKLTLGKKYLDCDGGVVLEGEGYDKDLTLSRIIEFVREKTEAKVADVLFGE